MIKDISYKEYRRSDDIHGTVLYPAVMVAPVQKDILLEISEQTQVPITSILDPFHGSGTALYESAIVFPNAKMYGCDINPLANLITRTKLSGVSSDIQVNINRVEHLLSLDKRDAIYEFPNETKWFRSDIAYSLSKVRRCIQQIDNDLDRAFFWCMLSDIIRKYSNSRSSTYKLHMKTAEKISSMEDNVIPDFLDSIKRNFPKYNLHFKNFSLYKTDTLNYLPSLNDHSIDLVITSPPYGDNQTTVPYGLFSSLAIRWISKQDLQIEGWELTNYSIVDSHSLGSSKDVPLLLESDQLLINPYLERISTGKQKKVMRFFAAYFQFLKEITRICDKYLVLTLGNRTVDNVQIDLSAISAQYLNRHGFSEYQTVSRNILNKRTPRLTSKVNNVPVQSIDKEYVLIYHRSSDEST